MRPLTVPQHRLPRGGNVCDFCGKSTVSKLYACNNFIWHDRDIFARSSGRWAACPGCSVLIDRGAWDALTARVMRCVQQRKGLSAIDRALLHNDLRALHKLLREHLRAREALQITQPRYSKVVLSSLGFVLMFLV